MVMSVFDKAFDVFVLRLGVTKRVYLDVSGQCLDSDFYCSSFASFCWNAWATLVYVLMMSVSYYRDYYMSGSYYTPRN